MKLSAYCRQALEAPFSRSVPSPQGRQQLFSLGLVGFNYRQPTKDKRVESCHVHEDSIRVDGQLPTRERSRLLNPMVVGSAKDAEAGGHSLALIRPKNTRFVHRPKTSEEIEEQREAFRRAARQTTHFDKELAELEPTPFDFRFRFEDESGRHDYQNGDWEAHAMFWKERHRTSEAEALKWMCGVFNDEYPRNGMVFAIGNQAKRPQTWQLVGVIRLDESSQAEISL